MRSLALAGYGAERGSSGEYALKKIERDVAGASCGEAYHAHKQRRRRAAAAPRRGVSESFLSRMGAEHTHVIGNIAAAVGCNLIRRRPRAAGGGGAARARACSAAAHASKRCASLTFKGPPVPIGLCQALSYRALTLTAWLFSQWFLRGSAVLSAFPKQ